MILIWCFSKHAEKDIINGAGKTTLTKLLMRLYEPTEGRILLNGVDVKMYDRTTYHKIFALVFQNIEVFAFPIWENVSMRERVDTNMDLVYIALERSGLDKKIEKYEKGIETQLLRIFDTEGIDLSGGERQRLAMARALYQARSVIVKELGTHDELIKRKGEYAHMYNVQAQYYRQGGEADA